MTSVQAEAGRAVTAPAGDPSWPRPSCAPSALAEQSLAVCLDVADRLRSAERVRSIVCSPANVRPTGPAAGPLAGRHIWTPESLANGHPGVALLHAALSEHDPTLTAAMHDHLSAALAAAPARATGGLFSGRGSLAFAAAFATATVGGYPTLLGRMESFLARYAAAVIARERARRAEGHMGISWQAYDTIVGLAGVGRVLLIAVQAGRTEHLTTLNDLLSFLVALTAPINVNGYQVPGWWISPEQYLNEEDKRIYPNGDFNVGLAHGIAGPLALLALAALDGVTVPGHRDAIRRIASWLQDWQTEGKTGAPLWPARVAWDDQIGSRQQRQAQPHPALSWCYGVPGIARALQLAGRALADPALEHAATAALRASLGEHAPAWQLTGPDFCHGYAGVLQITWRAAADSADHKLAGEVPRLAARVLEMYDPATPFGFQFRVYDGEPPDAAGRRRTYPLDVAGALEGAAGVALALLTCTGNLANASAHAWDAAFLLS